MKSKITFALLLLFAAALSLSRTTATAQEKASDKLPAAYPVLSPALCGKAVLLLSVGEQSIGREEFEIQCLPDGYSASGHTQIKVATTSLDLNSTLNVDKAGEPTASTAKGTVNGNPFDQAVTIKGATATLTSGSWAAISFTCFSSCWRVTMRRAAASNNSPSFPTAARRSSASPATKPAPRP